MGRLDSETETLIPVTGGFFDDATHTLRGEGFDASEDGTGRGVPLVPAAYTITGTNKTRRVAFETDLAGSLRTKPPGSQENSSSTVVAYRTSGNSGVMEQGDRTAALNTATDPNQNIVSHASGVRRLMPVECERLQGFPDGYTDIPGAKDGPRYKALGNSMATTVIQWIGRRIQMVVDARKGSKFIALAPYASSRVEAGKVITSVGAHAYPVDAATAARQFDLGVPVALVESAEEVQQVADTVGAESAKKLAEHFARIGERSEVVHVCSRG